MNSDSRLKGIKRQPTTGQQKLRSLMERIYTMDQVVQMLGQIMSVKIQTQMSRMLKNNCGHHGQGCRICGSLGAGLPDTFLADTFFLANTFL